MKRKQRAQSKQIQIEKFLLLLSFFLTVFGICLCVQFLLFIYKMSCNFVKFKCPGPICKCHYLDKLTTVYCRCWQTLIYPTTGNKLFVSQQRRMNETVENGTDLASQFELEIQIYHHHHVLSALLTEVVIELYSSHLLGCWLFSQNHLVN
jgi:hypothetical protein